MNGSSRTRICLKIAAAQIIAVLIAGSASAQWGQRAINVNGRRLNPDEVLQADQIAGMRLPDGYYWYNPSTGGWGSGSQNSSRSKWSSDVLIDASGGCPAGACVNILPYDARR
jgi:hypothetical protein